MQRHFSKALTSHCLSPLPVVRSQVLACSSGWLVRRCVIGCTRRKTTDGPDGSGGGLLGSRSGRERTIAWKLSCLPMDEPGSCCLRFLQEISLSLMPGQHAKPSSLKKLPRKSLLFDRRQTQLLQLNCSRQACECNMVQVSSASAVCLQRRNDQGWPHLGLPDVWDFDFVEMSSDEDTACGCNCQR